MAEDDVSETEIERLDEREDHDDVELDPVKLDAAIRQILVRDEARLMSVVSVGLIAIGVVFALAWLFVAWRVESKEPGALAFSGGSGQDADVVDRIIALVEISGLLIVPLLLVTAGCALRLYASRVFTSRDA